MRKHRLIRQIRIELVGRFGSHCSIVPHNLDTTIATIGCTSGPTFGVKFGDGLICGIDRKNKGPDFRPAPEVTRFIRLHLRRSEGQCGQLGGALFAPHCEQNLYANPKRTAKSSNSSRYKMPESVFCSNYFFSLCHQNAATKLQIKVSSAMALGI